MKTTILSKVLFVLLCSVRFSTIYAQGLSLVFNLSETDTLANMIAESKKYNISELTLSGEINIPNADYIRDLNKNGSLKNLNLANVTVLQGATIKRASGYHSYKNGSLNENLAYYDENNVISNTISYYKNYITDYNWYCDITITDNLYQDYFTRSYNISFRFNSYNKIIKYRYSDKWPKDVFRDCSFDNFIMPNSLTVIGGADCSFCPQSTKNLTIGDNIKIIGNYAFKGAFLGNVEFSSNIYEVGEGSFENTTGGILANNFFTNIKNIGVSAFKESKILPNTISLPNILELGSEAFMASTIMNVVLGDNIIKIGDSAFENCKTLQTFNGGANIEIIGGRTFWGCKQLNAFTPSNNLRTIGQEAFANNMELVTFSIPAKTESIGRGAFCNSGLKELDLADFCNYRRDIISDCDSLKIISVSNSNKKLKSTNGVLLSRDESRIITYPCAKEDVIYEISSKVTEIEDSAFYSVNKLRALTISENVCKIGKNAFRNSSILELKCLPSTTPKVTDNISGLDQSLVRLFVHDKDYSTYYIANYWGDFKNIFILEKAVSPNNLINVDVAGTLPEYIGFGNLFKYNSFRLSGKLNGDDIRYLREMAGRDVNGKETAGVLTDLDFSRALIVKGGDCYYKKSSKLTTADNEIGESMFERCNFARLAISESTTKICDKAFSKCYSLKNIYLGTQVNTIGKEAFSDCTGVTAIVSKATTPPACGTQALNDINKWDCVLYVPEGYVADYQAADQWKEFFFIEEGNEPVIRGDVNRDGKVDMEDATLVTNIILNMDEVTDAADVNQDGKINMPDVMFIMNYIKNAKFPDEE